MKVFSGMRWIDEGRSGFWFRVFGVGLHVGNRPKSKAMFSERYGYRKAWYCFGWRFEFLPTLRG